MRSKPKLEKTIEADFVKECKRLKLPVKLRKMNGLGYASWPDRLVVGPFSFFQWIEFKRPDIGKLSPGQADLFEELEAWGHGVPIFTDGFAAAKFVEDQLKAHILCQ
jgi:hypothetical protein